MDKNGVVYILTNPSFSEYVKIGYADDVQRRLVELNRSECMPFAFRVYATYEVPKRLADLSLHRMIDKLNPGLRAIDTFNRKARVREFYAMAPEDAYSLLEAIAEIHDRMDKLTLYPASEADRAAAETAEFIEIEVGNRRKTQPIALEEYLSDKNPRLVEIYNRLQEEVFDGLSGVRMRVIPRYIGWGINGRYFVEIMIQRDRLRVMTLVPSKDFPVGEKMPDTCDWTLNYRIYMDSLDEIEEVKGIILDSYWQRAL